MRSLSRWLETDTYSPSAIDTAPPGQFGDDQYILRGTVTEAA